LYVLLICYLQFQQDNKKYNNLTNFNHNQLINNKMNTIQKTLLYPIVSTGIIIIISSLNYLLTLFFVYLCNSTIDNISGNSPMILVYIVSFIFTIYAIINCCQYISEK
jgi:hypothetical protein